MCTLFTPEWNRGQARLLSILTPLLSRQPNAQGELKKKKNSERGGSSSKFKIGPTPSPQHDHPLGKGVFDFFIRNPEFANGWTRNSSRKYKTMRRSQTEDFCVGS